MPNVGIDAPNIPGVVGNTIPEIYPYMAGLESYGYMPSKEYPKPLAIGQTAKEVWSWNGYYNRVIRPFGVSNAYAFILPRYKVSPNVNNAAALQPGTNVGFAGQAPMKGIFTGVIDEDCRF